MSVSIFFIMKKYGPDISDTTLAILNLAMELLIAVMLVFTFKPTVSSLKILGSDVIKKINIKEIISVVIFRVLATIGGGKVLIDLLYLIDGNFVDSFIYDLILKINGPVQYMIDVIILCLLCPTIEELIFRSIIFKSVSKRFSAGIGIIISSIVFAAINVGNGIIGAFIFGIANCIIYIKYKNILMPILINLSYNVLICVSIIPFISRRSMHIVFNSSNIAVSLSVACLMCFIGIVLFLRFLAKNKKYIFDYNKELKANSESLNA